MMRKTLLAAATASLCVGTAFGDGVPDASVLPSEAHLAYQEREIMALIHWGPNTYTGQEWGFGNVPTTVVTPSRLDPAQWVAAMKAAEIKSAVLVAKHHDGFCLWPSKDNVGYSMSAVPAPNTGRDIVREMSDSCRREGLGFGVYLSPWDRHQASYAKPEYVNYFFAQWDDLMSNYGELCEIWLDGANGGSGWYGGANGGKGESRSIPKDYYRLNELLAKLHTKHPLAVAFGGGGEWSAAWCGNERGTSPETWWCPHKAADGKLYWMPSEADFPLRGGWVWHQEQMPKSLSQLTTAYFETVGRGAVMNLGIAPDREGRICEDDVRRLAEFGEWVRAFNRTDFAKEAKIQSSRQENRLVMELALPKAARFACVDIREDIAKGQCISSFEVEAHCAGTWKPIGKGTTVGHRRIVRFDEIESDKVRVTFSGIAPPQVLSVSLRPVPEVAGDDGARAKDTYPKSKWRVIDETCKEMLTAKNAIDGNYDTLWNTHPTGRSPFAPPQSFTVDCGELLEMRGFDYTPRHDGTLNGMVDGYEFHVSADGSDWKLAAAGEFGNLAANPVRQRVMFAAPMFARYFRFTATHALNGNDRIALAEVDLVAQKSAWATAIGGRIAAKHKILKEDVWHGFPRTVFDFNGHTAWVVSPKVAAAEGRPWTWTMQWADAFVERTGVTDLLARGWHHVTIETFGHKMDEEGLKVSRAFQSYLVDELGFATKTRLVGMSWGGFFSVRYATRYPQCVSRVFLDAPLLNFDGFSYAEGKTGCALVAAIGPWANRLPTGGAKWSEDKEMPLNMAETLAAYKVPLLLVYGDNDETVPSQFNSEPFAERFKAAGGKIDVRRENGRGHHPHGFPPERINEIVDFFERGCDADSALTPDAIAENCPVAENVRGHENTEWSISYAYHLTDAKKELPRVLMVGDSICNGYQGRVAAMFEGRANVTYWISSYCVTSPGYLQLLAFYLDEAKYDVIHFNNGLHSCDTPDADYEKSYRAALSLIREKQPGAKLVWATSTPLNTEDSAKSEKVARLNAAARRAASDVGGIDEDDLYSLVNPLDRRTYWVDMHHYTHAGYELLASQVVGRVSTALAK